MDWQKNGGGGSGGGKDQEDKGQRRIGDCFKKPQQTETTTDVPMQAGITNEGDQYEGDYINELYELPKAFLFAVMNNSIVTEEEEVSAIFGEDEHESAEEQTWAWQNLLRDVVEQDEYKMYDDDSVLDWAGYPEFEFEHEGLDNYDNDEAPSYHEDIIGAFLSGIEN